MAPNECLGFMAHGVARRVTISSAQALADLINNFASNQAHALGRGGGP